LQRKQPEKDKQNVDFAPPWKHFCARLCLNSANRNDTKERSCIRTWSIPHWFWNEAPCRYFHVPIGRQGIIFLSDSFDGRQPTRYLSQVFQVNRGMLCNFKQWAPKVQNIWYLLCCRLSTVQGSPVAMGVFGELHLPKLKYETLSLRVGQILECQAPCANVKHSLKDFLATVLVQRKVRLVLCTRGRQPFGKLVPI